MFVQMTVRAQLGVVAAALLVGVACNGWGAVGGAWRALEWACGVRIAVALCGALAQLAEALLARALGPRLWPPGPAAAGGGGLAVPHAALSVGATVACAGRAADGWAAALSSGVVLRVALAWAAGHLRRRGARGGGSCLQAAAAALVALCVAAAAALQWAFYATLPAAAHAGGGEAGEALLLFDCTLRAALTGLQALLEVAAAAVCARQGEEAPPAGEVAAWVEAARAAAALWLAALYCPTVAGRVPGAVQLQLLGMVAAAVAAGRDVRAYGRVLRHLPKVARGAGDACAICLQPFSGAARELPCGHAFHGHCIREWLLLRRDCPLCRAAAPGNDDDDDGGGVGAGGGHPRASSPTLAFSVTAGFTRSIPNSAGGLPPRRAPNALGDDNHTNRARHAAAARPRAAMGMPRHRNGSGQRRRTPPLQPPQPPPPPPPPRPSLSSVAAAPPETPRTAALSARRRDFDFILQRIRRQHGGGGGGAALALLGGAADASPSSPPPAAGEAPDSPLGGDLFSDAPLLALPPAPPSPPGQQRRRTGAAPGGKRRRGGGDGGDVRAEEERSDDEDSAEDHSPARRRRRMRN